MTLGVLGLSFAAAGCSDAKKVANAMEKVCKANCECEEIAEDWNDIKNCRRACEGYAEFYEALLNDRDDEACSDIGKIAKDIAKCAKESCGDARDECESDAYQALYECWPGDYYDYYGTYEGGSRIPNEAAELRNELREQLLYGPFASDRACTDTI